MLQIEPTAKVFFELSIHQIDCNEAKKEELRHVIAKKYGLPLRQVAVEFNPIAIQANGEKISLTADIVNNIQDPQFQQALFRQYMEAKEIKDVSFDDILAIDQSVNTYVNFDTYGKYKSYQFMYVKWSNYLSYGPDNYLDFSDLKGLVLLNSNPQNQGGKSTVSTDLLRFALFGKSQKTPTLESTFNVYLPDATEVKVEVGIKIQDMLYVIRRTVTRPPLNKRTPKSKCKQKVEYYRVINDNYELIDNIEGESVTQTNNIIRESVGSIDDFNLVISATSYTLGDLLRMGQTEKGKLFSRWLGLLTIEQKEDVAKKYYKDTITPRLLSKQYNVATLENEKTEFQTYIDNNTQRSIQYNQELNNSVALINNMMQEQMQVMSKKREVNSEYTRLDITTINASIENVSQELSRKKIAQSELKSELASLGHPVFSETDYNAVVEQIRQKNEQITALRVNYNTVRNEVLRIQNLVAQQVCPNCGQPVDAAFQQSTIQRHMDQMNMLTTNGTLLGNEIAQLENNKSIMENNRLLLNDIMIKQSKLAAIDSNIQSLALQLNEYRRQHDEYVRMSENIQFNATVDVELNSLQARIMSETSNKERLIREIEMLKSENTRSAEEISKRDQLISTLRYEEKLIKTWQLYLEMVGKNGIVKIVLNQALPIINNELRRILSGLCDFTVEMTIVDNKVCIEMVRDGKRMDLATCASGFESTISALALRSALASISNVSHSNALVLDEILEGVAVSNYDNVRELYNRIVKNYQFILHITHNEMLADWHNQAITVVKEDNISKIVRK